MAKLKRNPKFSKAPKITKVIEEESSESEDESSLDGSVASDSANVTETHGGDSADSDQELDPDAHKKSLQRLKSVDPDFYDFLEKNDENLLNFDDSGESDQEEADEIDDDGTVHTPGPIRGDSDESDFEPEDGEGAIDAKKITLKQVSQWQTELQGDKIKLTTLTNAIKAFNAAMLHVTTEDDGKTDSVFKVEGSAAFNAVVQMCVMYIQPAIKKYLGMEQSGKDPQKCKHFVKIKNPLIAYFNDLLKLLGGVTSANILTVLLKHLHQMSNFVSCFSRISKQLLKRLIMLWSTGEETVRVLAFLCILRITRNQQGTLLDTVLKTMYMTYVKNCKFVSPSTWPGINFMRRSLVEMFSLDLNVSYQHVFLYIRQLAIHLRNAIVVQKIESRQAVYNWQYVNSMHLWAELLSATCNKPQLQSLIYPLVMIITNAIKLVPTQQYYPLRFHCVEILIKLSKDSDTFIPIMPFLLEVLTSYDFNKKHSKVSMKPLDFSCILRLSKSQLSENGFKDTVIEKVYALLLEYTAGISHSVAFPDAVILPIIQIKQFLKNCSVPNYNKKMKQLMEKIDENSKFIERERKKSNFALTDSKLISSWETSIMNKGTPLKTYFDNWSKINKLQKRKKITKNEELADKLPSIKKIKKTGEKKETTEGPPELFPSDSEDDTGFMKAAGAVEKKEDKKEKKSKKKKVKPVREEESIVDEMGADGGDDLVQDFDVKDW